MNLKTGIRRTLAKPPGQGMVEFALTIPIFLMLVFGVLEMGRLLFVYSAVFTASREAARYGAAVGIGPNGRPYFQDCRGMKDAAIRIGNLAGLQDGDIIIAYDNPDTGKSGITCNDQAVPAIPADDQIELGDRVIVTVHISYTPIVGFLGLPDFNIESTARRTIVRNVRFENTTPIPSKTLNPTAATGLTQTAAAITATAAAATPEPACPPPGTFTVANNKKFIAFAIGNPGTNSDDITVESIQITWEESDKNRLMKLEMGPTGSISQIWSGSAQPSPVTLNSPGDVSVRTISPGNSKDLKITFDKNLSFSSSENWQVEIEFSGACEEAVAWSGQN